MSTMKAVVLYAPGPPSSLKIESRPIPTASLGQVLIKVHDFGLNRSKLFTRLGRSPNVRLPRILGIEAVGTVSACPGGEHEVGKTAATVMGGLGREVDGGYAEYTFVKAEYARVVKTKLPWDILGALPEMFHTSWER
jgi:NADPH:quinone reductase-like Zn-dependent oxidoreductase